MMVLLTTLEDFLLERCRGHERHLLKHLRQQDRDALNNSAARALGDGELLMAMEL
jgi:hypothetical protein